MSAIDKPTIDPSHKKLGQLVFLGVPVELWGEESSEGIEVCDVSVQGSDVSVVEWFSKKDLLTFSWQLEIEAAAR